MKTQTKSDTEEPATEFMLAEYATLRELRLSLDSLGESRMNFYLAAISGSVVGLGLLNQLSALAKTIFFINAAVIVGLLFLGSITFVRMVRRTVSKIELHPGNESHQALLRQISIPEITPYLWFSLYDDKPE